jgi:thioredoxin
MKNAETTSAVIKVTDDTFQDLVVSSSFSKPVLVDFWAQWCPPCHMLSPVLDEIAAELSDTLTVAKIDVDENQVTAQRYGILAMPTLSVFRNGEVISQVVGARRSQRAAVAGRGRNHASVREEKSLSHKRTETHTEGMGTAQETLPDEETAELTSGYWETYNARMASVGFGDVARRFPGLVGQAVRLGWSASRLDTAAALGLNVVSGVFAGFALFATTGVLEALFAAGPTPERVKAALPSLILVALATAARSGISTPRRAGRRAGWSRRWTRWSRCASMTWPRRWNSPRSTSRTSTTSCSAPGTGECGRRGSW